MPSATFFPLPSYLRQGLMLKCFFSPYCFRLNTLFLFLCFALLSGECVPTFSLVSPPYTVAQELMNLVLFFSLFSAQVPSSLPSFSFLSSYATLGQSPRPPPIGKEEKYFFSACNLGLSFPFSFFSSTLEKRKSGYPFYPPLHRFVQE